MDLYQTGIIVTLFLIASGSFAGAISQMEPGENFGITPAFSTITSVDGTTQDVNTMVTSINNDLAEVASSSDAWNKVTTGGGALLDSILVMVLLIVSALTNWTAIVDIAFGFAVGTPLVLMAVPLKIVLGIIMIYTIIRFLGDIISHLPFFGGS